MISASLCNIEEPNMHIEKDKIEAYIETYKVYSHLVCAHFSGEFLIFKSPVKEIELIIPLITWNSNFTD